METPKDTQALSPAQTDQAQVISQKSFLDLPLNVRNRIYHFAGTESDNHVSLNFRVPHNSGSLPPDHGGWMDHDLIPAQRISEYSKSLYNFLDPFGCAS